MRQRAALLAIVALLAGCATDARQAARENGARFDALDRDRDGSLSVSEALALPGLAARFETADADGDGKLSRAEFLRHLTPQSSVGGR